jgi:hypothetical protein
MVRKKFVERLQSKKFFFYPRRIEKSGHEQLNKKRKKSYYIFERATGKIFERSVKIIFEQSLMMGGEKEKWRNFFLKGLVLMKKCFNGFKLIN